MIDSFLESVNSIYYLINPDDLWEHLHSALNTAVEIPVLLMSKVCVCVALGCQAGGEGNVNMAIMWYENGRRYLDDRDWCVDLDAMQILALISIFHMARRPATSTHYLGNWRRILPSAAFNAVSQHRRSAQALLTLTSPSAQVAQSRSCSPFQ